MDLIRLLARWVLDRATCRSGRGVDPATAETIAWLREQEASSRRELARLRLARRDPDGGNPIEDSVFPPRRRIRPRRKRAR